MITIGVIAGNRKEFEDWLMRDTFISQRFKVNPNRAKIDDEVIIQYIADMTRAEGMEYDILIKVGTYYNKWRGSLLTKLLSRVR